MTNQMHQDELEIKRQLFDTPTNIRIAACISRMDVHRAKMDVRDAIYNERFRSIVESTAATQEDIRSLKTTLVITAVCSVAAIVLSIAALNATVISTMVASFDSGRAIAESIARAAETQLQIEQQRQPQTSPLQPPIGAKP